MEPNEAPVPRKTLTSTMQAPQDPSGGLIGEKRKSPDADIGLTLPEAQHVPGTQLAMQPESEVPAKKAKKKSGGKGKFGKKGSKKSNGRSSQPGVPGEQVEQRTLTPAFRDSMEVLSEVLLSKTDRAPQIQLSADRLTASSTKGYRMVRATTGPFQGAWYFEIKVQHLGETGHTRLGWSTRSGDLQAPVGYDTHSYGYRDVDGSKVHSTLREAYGAGYGEGDVVGCYINLPGGVRPPKPDIVEYKSRPYYLEMPDVPQERLPGAQVAFFKNGVCQGVAYSDIYGGQYFPAASLYTSNKQTEGCRVEFRFGPDWECPPADWGGLSQPEPVSKIAAQELEEARLRQAERVNGAGVQKEPAAGMSEKVGAEGGIAGDVAQGPDASGLSGALGAPVEGLVQNASEAQEKREGDAGSGDRKEDTAGKLLTAQT